jgi:signal transduction histidine kinase
MSHELRTPLNAIGGYVQLLELGIHGPVTDAQREALDRIARGQRHLLRLINDVLNLARIEAGRVDYATEEVPLAETIAAVLPMVEPQMEASGLACTSSVAPHLTARADREKVQQILINLLTNAVKFTPAGGRVTVVAERDRDRRRVRVSVSDTGIGIAADKTERVFEPFVQVDVGHARRNEGTGLGLAISRDLARGMGGDLLVESEEGRGSTFTLVLPDA